MIRLTMSVYAALSALSLSAALYEEDFTTSDKLPPSIGTNGGRASLFTENGNWNRCGKLEIIRATTNKAGQVTVSASAWIGNEPGKNGFVVKPDTEYRFSLSVSGKADNVNVEFIEWTGPDTWKDMKQRPTTIGTVKVHATWNTLRGTFRTSAKAQRAALHLQLYSSQAYGPLRHRIGDYVLFDNVLIEESPKKDIAALAARLGTPFAVARVSPTDPMGLPFLPDALFDAAPEAFRLVAAVNETKALPIAVANLTDRPADYRLVLETDGEKDRVEQDMFYRYNGARGLRGFPTRQITIRHAVAIKDSDGENPGAVLDPLPKMDEAGTLTVPAREARLVWFDFDTTDVKPGVYAGHLRILPLLERGDWKSTGGFDNRTYVGPARDYPVELRVLPIELPKEPPIPYGYFQNAVTEPMFQLMYDLGMREAGISPYAFGFAREGAGTDFTKLRPNCERGLQNIRDELAWAKARGSKLTFFIGFSAYDSLGDVLAGRKFKDKAEHAEEFVRWLKAVKEILNGLGVPDSDWGVETWDEIVSSRIEEACAVHAKVKAALPSVRLFVTLGAQGIQNEGLEGLEKLAKVTDGWILWDYGYFSRPDHRAFFARERAAGKHVSHYTCSTKTGMLTSDRYRGYRQRSWLAAANKLTGHNLFWFSDAPGGYGAQDWKVVPWGQIAYRVFDEFIPSVRAFAYREGQTDLRYLEALRQIRKNDKETKEFLESAPRKVIYDYSHDRNMADKMRKEAAKRILNQEK